MDNHFSDSGEINLEMPDFREAERSFEQTADCIKSTFKWPNGLIVTFTMVAGKIDMQSNGSVIKVDDKKYKIEFTN